MPQKGEFAEWNKNVDIFQTSLSIFLTYTSQILINVYQVSTVCQVLLCMLSMHQCIKLTKIHSFMELLLCICFSVYVYVYICEECVCVCVYIYIYI
jgi:hypothetical protein